ncbi:DHA2 family efflux MFS transporter permease subunit [Sphingosinicella sp.]|uniref:DHA2 family efflux MFS transporter permease subunit n=1 Tax=Sphingosinicella sp. TaxID=1917971 RepID=UPI00260B32F6|nr:DHA2 family efflux MFS transporter permease subunit [Sphingosinicella sp.]
MSASAAGAHGQPVVEVSNRPLLIVGIMMAMVMQVLDSTIANVALPHMQASLGATFDSVSWVLTSYILATAIAMPLTGWLSDRFGSRRLFIVSVAGFIITSMLCGIAVNLPEMVLFRVLQGASAAFVGPLSQTVMLDITPREQHAKAMALWGMGIMVGPIMGPILGGWLTDNYNWRWIFYINVPIGIATLAILIALLPSRPVRRRAFDLFGFSMLAIGLAALQLMLDRGQQEDWLQSWEIRTTLGVAIVGIWLVLVHMATGRRPMFEREMLTNRNFLIGLVFMINIGVILMATMALLPPMLQAIYGYPVFDTGLMLAPRGIGVLISMAIAGQLAGRVDARVMIGGGMALAAASLWWMTHWSLDMGWHPVVWSGVLQGLGLGFIFSSINLAAFATLPPRYRTDAASLLYLMRNLGSSVGISIVTAQLARSVQTSHELLVGNITETSLAPLNPHLVEGAGGVGSSVFSMIDAEITRQATMIGYINDFYLLMIVTILSIPLVLLLKQPAPITGTGR